MTNPTIDIIVPVWNQPFETRACLVSILNTCKTSRLIIINNSSSRETELMLEEFTDSLGERALYMNTERNIGFVPAANRALARSESDWAVLLRSNTTVNNHWLERLLEAAKCNYGKTGIISPAASEVQSKIPCNLIETCDISFAALMISRLMYEEIGGFDETLDGSRICLRDFQQRAASAGYLTKLVTSATINSGPELLFGSEERRRKLEKESEATIRERWGKEGEYLVYMPKEAEESYLEQTMQDILRVARLGNTLTIFLYSRQYRMALKHSWSCLHTGIALEKLPVLMPNRHLAKRIASMRTRDPDIQIVKGIDGIPVPGCDSALPFTSLKKLAEESEK